jgi:N-acetyl-anhydromuramyl-L-alanine amidase AmpD
MLNPRFIIVHHTATTQAQLQGTLNTLLGKNKSQVSVHFLVDQLWDAYKLSDPSYITWHAWVSQWGKLQDLNKYALGIEVIWPEGDEGFTEEQKKTVKMLIEHLQAVFNIPNISVLKHADITWAGSKFQKLWDWKSPSRKTDISRSFLLPWASWSDYQSSLHPKVYQ